LEVVFLPVFPGGEYVRWKGCLRAAGGSAGQWEVASEFARDWTKGRDVALIQQRLFDVLDHFVALRWTWLPGTLLDVYRSQGIEPDPSWRITRNDFRELRDLFISVFEQSYRYLPVLMAFANALERRDATAFANGEQRSLVQMEKLKAYQKEDLLRLFTPWGDEIVTVLDRDLRNAIGHASAVHLLGPGEVEAPKLAMPYTEFVALTARSLQTVLLCLDTVKLLLIACDET
jgi:hypothetical protein